MKIHSHSLLSGAALLCLTVTIQPCWADSSGSSSGSGANPFASAGSGSGNNFAGTLNRGNTNLPFDSWSGLSGNDISATGDPFDKTPIHELNNVNPDGSGQQISDYTASNGRSLSTTGSTGTATQTPIGRTSVNPATGLPGLQPTYTALQAGAVPGVPGTYSFTEIPFDKTHNYSYGFNTNAAPQIYSGLAHPNSANVAVPSPQSGGWLPPTSTGAVDLNTVDATGLRLKNQSSTNQSFYIP